MKTLIKNGRIVTAVDDYRADIFTRGETVWSGFANCTGTPDGVS